MGTHAFTHTEEIYIYNYTQTCQNLVRAPFEVPRECFELIYIYMVLSILFLAQNKKVCSESTLGPTITGRKYYQAMRSEIFAL